MLQGLSASSISASALDWRRLLGAIRQGLTTNSAAAAAHQQQTLASALRCRQIRPRRIAVIGSNGGVGTTTTAVLLASVLSATREDQTLLLTTHSDPSDVAARLSVTQAPSVTDVLAGLRRQGRIPPTPLTRTGLRVLSAPPPGSPAVDPGLNPLLDAAASGHAAVVVDAGVASRIGSLATLAQFVDTVVLVCATASHAAAATNAVLVRWRAQLPQPSATRLILVPVRIRTAGGDYSGDQVGRRLAHEIPTHVIPHDSELSRGRPIDMRLVSAPVVTAVLTLGADIMAHR